MGSTPAKIAVLMLTKTLIKSGVHEDIYVGEFLKAVSLIGEQIRIRAEKQLDESFAPFVFSGEEAREVLEKMLRFWSESNLVEEWTGLEVLSVSPLQGLEAYIGVELNRLDPEGKRVVLSPLVTRVYLFYKSEVTRKYGCD